MPKKLESSFRTRHENPTKTHEAKYPDPQNLALANRGLNFELAERGSEIPTSYNLQTFNGVWSPTHIVDLQNGRYLKP
jgi:hypothetical protein